MSQQDRYFDRSSQMPGISPITRLLGGSIPLFTFAGVRYRAHLVMPAFIAAVVVFGGRFAGFELSHRSFAMVALLAVALAHELSRCLVARLVGGHADEVLLWPLGGLIDPQSPHRPLARILTVGAGPLAVLLIGATSAALLFFFFDLPVTLRPDQVLTVAPWNANHPAFYLWYVHAVSYVLLALNLLPILPLDGGHAVQTMLWPVLGYGRSLLAVCHASIVASVAVGVYALASGYWVAALIMSGCLAYCTHRRSAVRAAGVDTFDHYNLDVRRPRWHRLSRYTKWRIRRQIRRESEDQVRVDDILEKVLKQGIAALSWRERRVLRRATIRQRDDTTDGA